MAEPRTQSFGGSAAGALAPVAGQVEKAKEQALAGTLRIDLDAAKAILKELAALRLRAADLVRDCADLDTPLKFGDNWVGAIMSRRLRDVAVGRRGAVTPVLTTFHQVLDDLEATVRFAAGVYETTDEQAEADLRRAAGRFGVEIEGAL
jgi:hypothetical protein